MCGRYVTRDQAAIERYLNLTTHQFRLTDRYNVVPTTTVPVVPTINGERIMSGMNWDLIPSWSKDRKIGYKTFKGTQKSLGPKRRKESICAS